MAVDQTKRILSVAMYALLGVAVACALSACFPSAEGKQVENRKQAPKPPNVILVLTDDLAVNDLKPRALQHMPNLKSLLIDKGTTFDNAFVTDSLCCPSRATILRGQYAHNHQIIGNSKPRGGFEAFVEQGNEDSTVATWLQDAGYRTVLIGKYLNGYDTVYVPEGWDDWHGIVGSHLSNDLNDNGRIKLYDTEDYYLDDVLSEKAAGYIRQSADSDPPFFMWLGTKAPHLPATPAPRHEGAFSDEPLPTPPSLDEKDVSDKPDWVRDNPRFSPDWIAYMDRYQRYR